MHNLHTVCTDFMTWAFPLPTPKLVNPPTNKPTISTPPQKQLQVRETLYCYFAIGNNIMFKDTKTIDMTKFRLLKVEALFRIISKEAVPVASDTASQLRCIPYLAEGGNCANAIQSATCPSPP